MRFNSLSMNEIVYYIKSRRKELNFTQQDMANKLKGSVRYYQTIESGSISLNELIALGKILNFRVQIIPEGNIIEP